MYKLVAESKGSIDPWIQGVTAPTVIVTPWIQGSMVHFTIYVYGGGDTPLQIDCKMRYRPLNPGAYGTLGFSYQFIHMLTN